MNNSNLKNRYTKIVDLVIVSIFLGGVLVLIWGGINSIFETSSTIRIGGVRAGVLPSDFRLILWLTLVLWGLGSILFILRHSVAIWYWLKSRPLVGSLVGVVFTLLMVAWLISIFQKTPAEQLAVAIGAASLDRVQKVLTNNAFESDYLDLQLGRSIEEGKFEIAAALVAEGADVNRAQSFGDYPLLISTIMFGEVEAIYFLLEQGADPNQIDAFGNTPLITLIDFRLPKESMPQTDGVAVAKALLAAGADPLLTNNFGKTVRDHAESREYQDLLALFP
ncbi:MAG: hypothetical protein ACI9EW_003077 [Cellvibrionaceae bacterium]|jgi:hypothetical protein